MTAQSAKSLAVDQFMRSKSFSNLINSKFETVPDSVLKDLQMAYYGYKNGNIQIFFRPTRSNHEPHNLRLIDILIRLSQLGVRKIPNSFLRFSILKFDEIFSNGQFPFPNKLPLNSDPCAYCFFFKNKLFPDT